MNRYLVTTLLAIAAAATSPAFADEYQTESTPFVSSKSRAQVQEELRQFRESGANPWYQGYDQLTGLTSERTRAEVIADFLATRDQAEALTGEDSGSAVLAGHPTYAL